MHSNTDTQLTTTCFLAKHTPMLGPIAATFPHVIKASKLAIKKPRKGSLVVGHSFSEKGRVKEKKVGFLGLGILVKKREESQV